MKKSYLKGSASFMIALILSLPIYSSFVFATLSNGYVYGEADKVKGYYRRNENIYLYTTAKISRDTQITPSQVHLFDLSGPGFNTCNDQGDGSFSCSYKMNSNLITQNPYRFKVLLYNDANIKDSESYIDGAFDEITPEIKSFTITPSLISQGNVNLQYDIYDYSYSTTDTSRCSGINRIELSYNGAVFSTNQINSQPNLCRAYGTITVPITNINPAEGAVEVLLTAYDNFNQPSTATSYFNYDTQGPIIDTTSLEIKDSKGNLITHIRDAPIPATITFIVESEDLDANNVYGDISEINVDNPTGYKNKKATCSKINEVYRCIFTNVQVKLTQSTTTNIIINASDKAGNIEPTVLSKNILYDNIGPSVTSIKTNKADNNINYVGSLTTFIVELNEDGIGINKNDIKIDLSSIKTGLSNKAADECISSGSQWTCYWYNIIPDQAEGEKTISLSSSSTDILGNKVTGTLSANVMVDKTAPVVVSSQVTARGVGVEAIEGYIKTNDILDVTLNIKEKNKLRAYADFSSFVTTQNNITGSCSKSGQDDWTCKFISSQIDVPGHIISDINFNIIDIAGNSKHYKKTIEVLEYEGAVNVSYWTSSVKCSPNLVDRQITNLVNTRVYCSIILHPITPDQETLSINLGSCRDNFNNSLGYIENVGLINAQRGSTEPYLSIDLIKGEMTIDRLSVICPLKIISRVGTKINKEPEIEPVKVDIGFYNMPLGEYGEGIESKIQDAKDDAFGGIWKIIGTLKKLLGYAKLVCNVLLMLQKIKLIWNYITVDLTAVHLRLVGTPVEPILAAIKSGGCNIEDVLGEEAKKSYIFWEGPCKFINCQMSPNPPDSDKGNDAKKGSWWANIKDSIGSWTYQGNQLLAKATTNSKLVAFPFSMMAPGASGTIGEVTGKQPYQYMNARDNLLVAIVTGCIPGIINGLEKYRQIKCLYADCLEQNSVNNVPVKICEDQKSYATCKYIFGEIFAILPWTALFDYYMGMIRSALSDPLSAAGIVLSFECKPVCEPTPEGSMRWKYIEGWCRGVAFMSILGEVINDVNGIIDDYKQMKGDYCARIKEEDNKDKD